MAVDALIEVDPPGYPRTWQLAKFETSAWREWRCSLGGRICIRMCMFEVTWNPFCTESSMLRTVIHVPVQFICLLKALKL
jgi:hypothetical protein